MGCLSAGGKEKMKYPLLALIGLVASSSALAHPVPMFETAEMTEAQKIDMQLPVDWTPLPEVSNDSTETKEKAMPPLYAMAVSQQKPGLEGLHLDGLKARIQRTIAPTFTIQMTNGKFSPFGMDIAGQVYGEGVISIGSPQQEAVITFTRYDADMEMIYGNFILSRDDGNHNEHCFNPMGIGPQGVQMPTYLSIPFSVRRLGSTTLSTDILKCVPSGTFLEVSWGAL